jgi:predicted nuclease with TOPRIM domain
MVQEMATSSEAHESMMRSINNQINIMKTDEFMLEEERHKIQAECDDLKSETFSLENRIEHAKEVNNYLMAQIPGAARLSYYREIRTRKTKISPE